MRLAYLFASVLISTSAFAADLGTYRPGNPYHSVIVPTANICESQCAGDARCRSWNYVKASPQAPGVCEFQSEAGPAISSAISISGVSMTVPTASDRLVQGQTNTIRVGTSVAPSLEPSVSQEGQRRIVRQPVPSPQMMATPRSAFQPALGGYSTTPAPIVGQQPPQPPVITRAPARTPYAQRHMIPAQPNMAPAQPPQMAQSQGRPPIGQPIAAPQMPAQPTMQPQAQMQPQMIPATTPRPSTMMNMNMPRSSAQTPVTWQNAQQFNRAPVAPQPTPQPVYQGQPQQPTMPQQPIQGQPAPSLYGNLNDDMPTVSSAPTTPVAQSPLAGGPPR